jgi:hypothetical protein
MIQMIQKISTLCTLILLTFLSIHATLAAEMSPHDEAAPSPSTLKPILILRFNQPNLVYQHALHNAIQTARYKNPHFRYRITSFYPESDNQSSTQTAANQALADKNAQIIEQKIITLGISKEQLSWQSVGSNQVKTNEIYIDVIH